MGMKHVRSKVRDDIGDLFPVVTHLEWNVAHVWEVGWREGEDQDVARHSNRVYL